MQRFNHRSRAAIGMKARLLLMFTVSVTALAFCQAFIKHDYQQIIRDLSVILSKAQVNSSLSSYILY